MVVKKYTTNKVMKEVEEKVLSQEFIQCDKCGKVIFDIRNPKGDIHRPYGSSGSPHKIFAKMHTYHNEWGNDSVDSHEDFDFCSFECLTNKLVGLYTEAEEYCYSRTIEITFQRTDRL